MPDRLSPTGRPTIARNFNCPAELAEEMQKHPDTNWSAVIRKAIREHIAHLELTEQFKRFNERNR